MQSTEERDATGRLSPLRCIEAIATQIHDQYHVPDRAKKQELLGAVIAAADKIAAAIEEGKLCSEERSELALLLGRMHDAREAYSAKAEMLLTRCIKLTPSNPDCWNALAHCFFKKRDAASAKSCLDESIKRRPTAAAWRLMSQLLRQMKPAAEADPLSGVRSSIDAAASAITLNVSDARSWAMMANAYLGLFFGSAAHETAVLAKAHKAYSQAAKAERDAALRASAPAPGADDAATAPAAVAPSSDATAAVAVSECRALVAGLAFDARDPDLHFNWAQVLSFQEDYASALAQFQEAADIDPSLAVADEVEAVRCHVVRAADLCSRSGGLKGKRLQSTVAACELPAYSRTAAGSAALGGRAAATVSQLAPGGNAGVFVLLKPVMALPKREKPPSCMVMLDADAAAVCVSAYHLSEGMVSRLTDRETVLLLDPIVKRVVLPAAASGSSSEGAVRCPADGAAPAATGLDAGEISYTCLHVASPEHFCIDGRPTKAGSRQMELHVTTFDS